MKIVCIHCGGSFAIRAEQLGGRGLCPHCRKPVVLPRAEEEIAKEAEHRAPSGWLDNSLSGVGSLLVHLTLFLVIALFQQDGGGGEGIGEEVLIGVLPSETLTENQEAVLSTDPVLSEQPREELEELVVEIETPAMVSAASSTTAADDLAFGTPSPSGAEAGAFDLGSVQIGGSMAGGSWDGMLQSLRRNGLEIVICFDSTGSMSGEIDQVKEQIDRIATTLLTLVPKARISLCTYRDLDPDDEYAAKGLPLTSSVQDLKAWLATVSAGGGGDHPEAVEEGMKWAMGKNQFRPAARKVILIFGDAPPHEEKTKECVALAEAFRTKRQGIVSTVTCRAATPMPEFYEIASAGGGEAFLTTDQRQIMTQLMVLVFGSRHRDKVMEAFKLLER